jgi:hypothetical protein
MADCQGTREHVLDVAGTGAAFARRAGRQGTTRGRGRN